MRSLAGFSNAAAPVFADLGKAAPAFTEATRLLTPFSSASTVALKSLGAVGEEAGPTLAAADPVVRKARDLARSGVKPNAKLADFLASTKETGGFDRLVELIYNSAASTNGFDKYGHFLRSLVTLTNCLEYQLEESGCSANFTGAKANTSSLGEASLSALLGEMEEEEAQRAGGTLARPGEAPPGIAPSAPTAPETQGPRLDQGRSLGARVALPAPRRALLDYLLAP
jgi:hypothetical protein